MFRRGKRSRLPNVMQQSTPRQRRGNLPRHNSWRISQLLQQQHRVHPTHRPSGWNSGGCSTPFNAASPPPASTSVQQLPAHTSSSKPRRRPHPRSDIRVNSCANPFSQLTLANTQPLSFHELQPQMSAASNSRSQPSRKPHRPQHPQLILLKAPRRITNRTHHPRQSKSARPPTKVQHRRAKHLRPVSRTASYTTGSINIPLMVKSRRSTSSRASVENRTASGRRPSL